MTLDEYIVALKELRAIHGGNLRVTRRGPNREAETALAPDIGWIRVNKNEKRTEYWSTFNSHEEDRWFRQKGEMVIRL
jgi:hypothetical protein